MPPDLKQLAHAFLRAGDHDWRGIPQPRTRARIRRAIWSARATFHVWRTRNPAVDTHVYRDDTAEALRSRAEGLAAGAFSKLREAMTMAATTIEWANRITEVF